MQALGLIDSSGAARPGQPGQGKAPRRLTGSARKGGKGGGGHLLDHVLKLAVRPGGVDNLWPRRLHALRPGRCRVGSRHADGTRLLALPREGGAEEAERLAGAGRALQERVGLCLRKPVCGWLAGQ